MNELPNLDTLYDIERGIVPQPEQPRPSDTETVARCLIRLRPVISREMMLAGGSFRRPRGERCPTAIIR